MNRKLLPYERGLCQQLGVSEDEYLLFLAAQRDYALSPAERQAELRGDMGVTALVLTIIGTLVQVGAALLAPKPEQPKFQAQRRDRTFAPRYGFNSTQELARYGDPINLVYCNQTLNPQGAVRVNTALLWSSVQSTGSGQFMQLLLLVGAAGVKKLDFGKTAFGQLPLKQLSPASTWLYYSQMRGPVRVADKVLGMSNDPAVENMAADGIVHRLRHGTGLTEGYSMAFTPTAAKELGVYAPIPINVEVYERDQDGDVTHAPIGIESRTPWSNGQWYSVGSEFKLFFKKVDREQGKVAEEAAKDLRLQLVNNLDRGATYELGSAIFRLVRWEEGDSLNKENVAAYFECTEAGFAPSTNYTRVRARVVSNEDRALYKRYKSVLEAPSPSEIVDLVHNGGISSVTGAMGLSSQWMAEHKLWLGLGTDQETIRQYKNSLFDDDVYIRGFGKEYDFSGPAKVTWVNDLGNSSEVTYPEGGSIAYTELILQQFLAEKPKLSTKALRDAYRVDIRKLRRIKDKLMAGLMRKQVRKNIIETDAEAIEYKRLVKYYDDLLSADREDLEDTWREEAKRQPTATNFWAQIQAKRNELDALTDAQATAKRLAKIEQAIETLRDDRRTFIDNYVDRKRRENKHTTQNKQNWRQWRTANRDALRERIDARMEERVQELIDIIEDSTAPFQLKGFTPYVNPNEWFACGLELLREKRDNLTGEFTTDQRGTSAVRTALRKLIDKKKEALVWLQWLLKNWDTIARDVDDPFYTKCIAKRARVDYQTITNCDRLTFNFRVRVFRRISGRQLDYGTKEAPDGYRLSDNGIKNRAMFFRMMYRDLGAASWTEVPKIFVIERGNDADHYVFLQFVSSRKIKREFRFEPLTDPKRVVNQRGISGYIYIKNGGLALQSLGNAGDTISYFGREVDVAANKFPDLPERGPMYTNEWDMFSVNSDTQVQFSFDNGPEATLVNVTEQVTGALDAQKYKDMSLMAFHAYAANGVDDLRSISAYALEGKQAWKVNESSGAPYASGEGACYAPDIFTDTVMDSTNGIKNFANANAVDWQRLALAKRFCKNNGLGCQLFMDGVIADRRGWREFWVETAPFSLLEFARLNGKETLVPALPVTPDGRATTNLTISALFNEANILEDSYREEYLDYGDNTKDLVATVIYREISGADEVFARNTSTTLCLKNTNDGDAVWQTFDLSDWVSQRKQAELYGRMLCQQRRHVHRTIEFRTVPTDSPVQPGAYIYVDIGLKRWDSVRTGVVQDGGVLDLPLDVAIVDGTYTLMTYDSQSDPQVHSGITITNGVATNLTATPGSLFVLGNSNDAKRVFRVTDVSMNEEAEITVRGVEHPCVINGGSAVSLVADLSDGLFRTIGVD